ncbi:hypothetical protein JFU49_13380 [Pseudomonas sp. TH03]|uniref:hypothetical protein n=1 Tax=Pseudomonas sp. TH03 TaxID=2796369 RepID=UPI0019142AA1|nr:hypothetical protein [Pseudomonas sp. TH03]MBK5551249.1 hypothetical protein [Pseudomonas sp. TH03]
MFREDKQKIQDNWQEEIYPRNNSIMSNNGFYCLFDISEQGQLLQNKSWLPALDFALDENQLCEGLATLYISENFKDYIIQCGECLASGEDGFISLTKKSNDELVWLIVLSTTNPFEKIELHEEFIHVTSSSGTKVTIPPERPDRLTIQWE